MRDTKQKPDKDGWYHRKDSTFPYQSWNLFEPDDAVEVVDRDGNRQTCVASALWWGYEDHNDSVIQRARLAKTPFAAQHQNPLKGQHTEVLRKGLERVCATKLVDAEEDRRNFVSLRHLAADMTRAMESPDDCNVTLIASYKSSGTSIHVPPALFDKLHKLIVEIVEHERSEYLKDRKSVV